MLARMLEHSAENENRMSSLGIFLPKLKLLLDKIGNMYKPVVVGLIAEGNPPGSVRSMGHAGVIQVMGKRGWVLATVLWGVGFLGVDGARAELTRDQQKCVNALHTNFQKVSTRVGAETLRCLSDVAKQKTAGTVEACVAADLRGKIAAAKEKTLQHDGDRCDGLDKSGQPRRPDVFVSSPEQINTTASEREATLLAGLLGPGGAPILASENASAAQCQGAVARSMNKCQDLALRTFNQCRKLAVKDGADTAAELEACVLSDPKGKIARACNLGSQGEKKIDKVRRSLERTCVSKDVDLCAAFPHCCPPCSSLDVDCVHQCVQLRSSCETCRDLNVVSDLANDCDLECLPLMVDPGDGPWTVVPDERVVAECGLDPDILNAVDEQLGQPWAVVRYGKLCHEYYPSGQDEARHAFSATKTLAALVTGIASYETRDLPQAGPKTGPLSDTDRVDYWLDSFSFNPDAQIAHVLAMVAHNEDLSFEAMEHIYDAVGTVQINRLSDVVNTAIAQDPDRLGSDLEVFTQKFLYSPLGMTDSVWNAGLPDKVYAFNWFATLHDMARVGQLILHDGIWDGKRLLDPEWVYRMTHPAFEDSNTSYGYLTWLVANSNYNFGGILGLPNKLQFPLDTCSPPAIHPSFPHGLSEAVDCYYEPPYTCDQQFDVGVWGALGALGQLIVGHKGLDLVMVGQDQGTVANTATLWNAMRAALVDHDPIYMGDTTSFCEDYRAGDYAPDLPVAP